jgi:hypothetical protein
VVDATVIATLCNPGVINNVAANPVKCDIILRRCGPRVSGRHFYGRESFPGANAAI